MDVTDQLIEESTDGTIAALYEPLAQWEAGDCPGGLAWANCRADDCGVQEDGTGCELA